jgi:hypothetical protein
MWMEGVWMEGVWVEGVPAEDVLMERVGWNVCGWKVTWPIFFSSLANQIAYLDLHKARAAKYKRI